MGWWTRGKQRARFSVRSAIVTLLMLHAISLLAFINGFLLSRIHLGERGTPDPMPPCAQPYTKLVWLVVDALRYDFVVSDGRYPCPPHGCAHQRHMPFLSSLLIDDPDSALAFRYVADAPTTTTQRLKSMVSGGLPTFFDISNAFSARAMDEDNLIDQFVTEKKRLSFLGDATWTNLFPTQFDPSLPFPCYNVKDLDTVDDGIWTHLLPTLRRHEDWDGLVVHYLGVDHAGHSVGVESARMAQKLHQMDDHIHAVVELMRQGAHPGGPFEHALLLISGDHGQTLGGDHGGGSPEEVDSVLVAVDIASLHTTNASGAAASGLTSRHRSPWAAACRRNCTCGDDRNQCADDLPQIDLVPTLAVLMGVPIPFVNLGKLSPELWSLRATRCSGDPGGDQGSQDVDVQRRALAKATAANARQVQRYLTTYASHKASRFPLTALNKLRELYDALPSVDGSTEAFAERKACENTDDCGARAHLEYLEEAGNVSRRVWTQFGDGWMVLGVSMFAACLVLHAGYVVKAFQLNGTSGMLPCYKSKELVVMLLLWAGVTFQCLGIFSFFYLLSEGKAVSWLVTYMAIILALFQHSRLPWWRSFSLACIATGCVAGSAFLGLAQHSGFGFWQRLMVHEPQDSGLSSQSTTTLRSIAAVSNGSDETLHASGGQAAILSIGTLVCVHLAPLGVLWVIISTNRGVPSRCKTLMRIAFAVLILHMLIDAAMDQGQLPRQLNGVDCLDTMMRSLGITKGIGTTIQSVPLSALAPILQLPLRVLLPRFVLISMLAAGMLALVVVPAEPTGTSATLAACLGVVLLLISPVLVPLMALMLYAQLYVLLELVKGVQRNDSEKATSKPQICSGSISAAAVLAAMQTQVFFVTGHLCEFAGLQYTAAFAGFEEFHLFRSGLLLALDTFGGMILVGSVGIRAAVSMLTASKPAYGGEPTETSNRGKSTRGRGVGVAQESKTMATQDCIVLLFGLARAAACFCATLSAGIQRRHLYAWALFAPKFVFEVSFLLVTDVVLLLLTCSGKR